jgi:hypothetical protein
MVVFSKLTYRFNAIHIKIPMTFFKKIKRIWKYKENPNNQINLHQKQQTADITLTNFKHIA